MLGRISEACAETGQVDEGLGLVTEALELVQQNGERLWEAELHRLRGELLLRQDTVVVGTHSRLPQATEAEACFLAGPGHCPPPAGQILGAAGGAKPESLVAAAGQARRRPTATGGNIRLVHRGF
jgi:hypothetical protein